MGELIGEDFRRLIEVSYEGFWELEREKKKGEQLKNEKNEIKEWNLELEKKKKKQRRVEKRRAGTKMKMGFFSKSKRELGRKTRSVSLREKKKQMVG